MEDEIVEILMMKRTRLKLSSINSIFAVGVPRVPHCPKSVVYP